MQRLAAEFGVIVLGVLVALSVDAWWDSVQERETERGMLEALADELQVAEETLLDYLEVDSAIIHNADLVLGTPGLSSDSVSVLLNRFYYTIPRQAALPTIDEATTTGRLRLFRNPDLRVRITEFTADLRTLTAYHVQTEAQWNEVARPILYASTDFDELVAGGNPHWGTTGAIGGPAAKGHPDTHLGLRNVIRDRRAFTSVRRMLVRRRLADLDSLRTTVVAELGS